MNHKAVLIPEGTFRSPLIRITAILCAIAAGCAFISIISLVLPGYFLMYQVSPDSTVQSDARLTWTILHCGFLLFGFLCSLLMASSLLQAAGGKVHEGMDLLGRGLHALRIAITVTSAAALALFVIMIIRYTFALLSVDGGILMLFSGLLAEAVMGAQAFFIFVKLRQFLESVSNTAASIAYSYTSGKLRGPSISRFPSIGFLILGAANLMLFINRMSAFSAWQAQDQNSLLLLFPAAMFLLMSIADILLFLYLHKYKQTSEYLLYKGTPVEEKSGEQMTTAEE